MFIDDKEIDRGKLRTACVSAGNLEHFKKFANLSGLFDKLGVQATIVGSAASVIYRLIKTLEFDNTFDVSGFDSVIADKI